MIGTGARSWALVVLLLLQSSAALADQNEMFGTSIPVVSRAGAGVLLEDGGASAAFNAAALGVIQRDSVRVGYLGGIIRLDEVEGVTRLDGRDDVMPLEPIQPHAMTFDGGRRFGDFLKVGGTVTFPIPYIYFHATKDPWVPTASRWQSRFARANGSVGGALRLPVRGLPGVGGVSRESATQGGIWLAFAVTMLPRGIIDIDLELNGVAGADGEDGTIEVVMNGADLVARLRFRPQVGLLVDLGTFHPALHDVRFGVSWKPEMRFDVSPILLNVRVRDLGNVYGLFSLVEELQAKIWLELIDFYDPQQLRFSFAINRPRFAVAFDGSWNNWSRMKGSYARVIEGEGGEQGLLRLQLGEATLEYPVLNGRQVGSDAFHDSVDLAIGFELRPPGLVMRADREPLRLIVRFGYKYSQNHISPSAGPSGLMDSDTHAGAVGLGLILPAQPVLKGPLRVDLGVQVQRIMPMELPKSAEGLAGITGMPVAYAEGARWPGGFALVGGLSVGLEL